MMIMIMKSRQHLGGVCTLSTRVMMLEPRADCGATVALRKSPDDEEGKPHGGSRKFVYRESLSS